MSLPSLARPPLSADRRWPDLARSHPAILRVFLLLVLPLSLLPPQMLYCAGMHYPEAFMPAPPSRNWAAVAMRLSCALLYNGGQARGRRREGAVAAGMVQILIGAGLIARALLLALAFV